MSKQPVTAADDFERIQMTKTFFTNKTQKDLVVEQSDGFFEAPPNELMSVKKINLNEVISETVQQVKKAKIALSTRNFDPSEN